MIAHGARAAALAFGVAAVIAAASAPRPARADTPADAATSPPGAAAVSPIPTSPPPGAAAVSPIPTSPPPGAADAPAGTTTGTPPATANPASTPPAATGTPANGAATPPGGAATPPGSTGKAPVFIDTGTSGPFGSSNSLLTSELDVVDNQHPFRSPQHFAFELRFGPYRPDVDGEFSSGRHPYQDFFGSGHDLITDVELDYEILHKVGTLAVGVGLGYFTVTGTSPFANGTGLPSGDKSELKIIPLSLSAVYRFDYFLQRRNIPVVPYGKLGLDWAYWQITDGNGDIANDGMGGTGRGGTFGWHVAGGVALVLDFLDPEAAHDFDTDLGVNHTALVFEYSYADISGLGQADRLHVGDADWTLGLMMEF